MRRKILLVVAFLYVTVGVMAQPFQFNYQAVLRDADRQILPNFEATVTVSIYEGTMEVGDLVFSEDHEIKTTPEGVVYLNIGSVNKTGLTVVDWSEGIFYISISVNGTVMGSEQLLSVPFSLYSFKTSSDSKFFGCSIFDSMFGIMDDIFGMMGVMSDDMLQLSSDIGEMADRIGDMADKIVETEVLMSQMVIDLAEIKANTSGGACGSSVFITNAGDGSPLASGVTPMFTINEPTGEYLLYVTSTLLMNSNTVSVLINDTSELDAQWMKLQELASEGKIYIAVKTINNNQISSISNVLTYDTSY